MNQFVLPKLSPFNKIIIIASVALFLLDSILSKAADVSLLALFGLAAGTFLKGFIWQIFTYPFISRGLLEVVFNCIMMWFIGSELENIWGRKRYVYFLLFSWLGAGFIYLLVSALFFSSGPVYFLPLTGLAGATSALCLAYAILFPNREFTFMLLFPMKAKYFCGILIAMSLYQGFFSSSGALAWGHLGAMLFGYLYMYLVSHTYFKSITPGGNPTVSRPKSAGKKQGNPWSLGALKKQKKGHLSLVKDDEDDEDDEDPPKYLH
jgi:membrane associated rhomboid family serine protease